MERRTIAVFIGSCLLGLIVAGLFYRSARSGSAKGVRMRTVVIATVPLAIGAKIKPENLKTTAFPEAAASGHSFSRIEEVKDRVVVSAIVAGEPVLGERLAAPGSTGFLAPLIPAGYRAATIKVNDVIGVSGFAQPGMHVDVLSTGHPPGSQDIVTRTVLQDVVVLSAGQSLQPDPTGRPANVTAVTLLVRPSEAETLGLASEEGHIQLVLRNSMDNAKPPSPGTRLSAVYGAGERAPEKAMEPASLRAPKRTLAQKVDRADSPAPGVEVIRRSQRTFEPLTTATKSEGIAERAYASQ